MTVEVRYFGMLAEQMGRTEEVLDLSRRQVNEIKQEMENTHWPLKSLPYRIAVNEELVSDDHEVHEGDVLAFLPPFAGG